VEYLFLLLVLSIFMQGETPVLRVSLESAFIHRSCKF